MSTTFVRNRLKAQDERAEKHEAEKDQETLAGMRNIGT
jgi:hypothetical protein